MKFTNSALIGYSGFVGSNLRKTFQFDSLYNSKNIQEIAHKKFDTIICAAPSGWKWKVNQNPHEDLDGIKNIFDILCTVDFERMILISTIDVLAFREPWFPPPRETISYGGNRLLFENLLLKKFKSKITIIRLPGLFGKGLKKNIIYDLQHGQTNYIHLNSQFQWLDIEYVIDFLKKPLSPGIFELFPEPLPTRELIKTFFPIYLKNCKNTNGVYYNFKPEAGFCMSKREVVKRLKKFIEG